MLVNPEAHIGQAPNQPLKPGTKGVQMIKRKIELIIVFLIVAAVWAVTWTTAPLQIKPEKKPENIKTHERIYLGDRAFGHMVYKVPGGWIYVFEGAHSITSQFVKEKP